MWYDILFSKSIFYIWISGLVVVFLMSRLAISSSLTMLTRSWFLEESKECSSLENNTFTLLFFGDVTFKSNNDFYEALLDNRLTWDILFDGDFLSFLLLALFIGEWIKGEDKSIGICCSPAIILDLFDLFELWLDSSSSMIFTSVVNLCALWTVSILSITN